MSKLYLGIDPGQRGAIAFLQDDRCGIYDCPDTIPGMVSLLTDITHVAPTLAVIEKVHAFYKSSAKSAFCFGENFGAWQAVLATRGIPYQFVTPRTWQKCVFDSAKRLDNSKKQAVELAERLFPGVEFRTKRGRIIDGRADALLLAEFLRRQDSGQKAGHKPGQDRPT